MSHEYDGEGSISDMAQIAQEGIPKDGIEDPRTKSSRDRDWWQDWKVRPIDGPGAWKEPKRLHKVMMNKFLQSRAHLIFCLRAEEKIKLERDPKTKKMVIEDAGWTPICEKRFMFEMTISFTLRPDMPGKPQYDLPHKINDQHRHIFPDGQFITIEAGEKLGSWAKGGVVVDEAAVKLKIDNYARDLAARLKHEPAEFETWWNATSAFRASLKIPVDRMAKMSKAANEKIAEKGK